LFPAALDSFRWWQLTTIRLHLPHFILLECWAILLLSFKHIFLLRRPQFTLSHPPPHEINTIGKAAAQNVKAIMLAKAVVPASHWHAKFSPQTPIWIRQLGEDSRQCLLFIVPAPILHRKRHPNWVSSRPSSRFLQLLATFSPLLWLNTPSYFPHNLPPPP
jgi:hypothetical protein